jgi:hypothetical protein
VRRVIRNSIRPLPASCAHATLRSCRIGARYAPVALDAGCRRAFGGRIGAPQALRNGVTAIMQSPGAVSQARRCCARAGGDVGNRMIGQRQARVGRPTRGIEWRTSLRGVKDPQPQMLEDATDDSCILDSSAITRVGPLHLGHFSGSAS